MEKESASTLRRASKLRPKLAFVLGSGFQPITEAFHKAQVLPYAKLDGFIKPTVTGHDGWAIIGHLGNTEVIALNGRAHYYEGHSLSEITFPIRVLAEYGVESVLLTNAAGGINRKFKPGDLMRFSDHMNFIGDNPLRGLPPTGSSRFIDLTETYDRSLAKQLTVAARKTKTNLFTGVYCAVAGPSYETPAEIKALSKLGADAIGMSTVPEAIVARQCGLRVAALSCITNAAAGITKKPLTHEEVLTTGMRSSRQAVKLLTEFARNHA